MKAACVREAILLVLTFSAVTGAVAKAGDLDFEARVAAQAAIERVYHSYRIDAPEKFEDAVPREILERKVRTYLAQSDALEERWNAPITADALRNELNRIANRTRIPERLLELFAALDDDPVLIQETLVRQVLADRLARAYFEADARIHAGADEASRVPWDAWWADQAWTLSDPALETVADEGVQLPALAGRGRAPCDGDYWDNGILDDLPDHRSTNSTVWTGSEMLIWGGVKYGGNSEWTGLRYDPATDTWGTMATDGAPPARYYHAAVWTGSEMIVWGGGGGPSPPRSGGRYDPVSDTWASTSIVGAPQGRTQHTLVWDGTQMIVWGGYNDNGFPPGGRYDPSSNTWQPVSTTGQPSDRLRHRAVWTGDRMIVWGGSTFDVCLGTGGRYDPASDTWSATEIIGAPEARCAHSAVWTGDAMIVWGGEATDGDELNTGGLYDPDTNSWTWTSTVGAPSRRKGHVSVWTGTEMVVFGGKDPYYPTNTGGRFDPVSDTWTPTAPAPTTKYGRAAVWTGTEMVVWSSGEGARYAPATDSWTMTYGTNSPKPREEHTAVWTGSEMIVWGGGFWTQGGDVFWFATLDTGGAYDPVLDAWTPTSMDEQVPTARARHTAVWTGSEMVVWGGHDDFEDPLFTGARYDPVGQSWLPTWDFGAPDARFSHAAVWDGYDMIVWGGDTGGYPLEVAGARYDPWFDMWFEMNSIGAPVFRKDHVAVFTGREMIVWGGRETDFPHYPINTGGIYDTWTGSWSWTSTFNAPVARWEHTAVWTGSEMIVWGGESSYRAPLATGGRYDPTEDVWVGTSLVNVHAARRNHTAVWTGREMIVWGGDNDYPDEWSGSRYLPEEDTWFDVALQGQPSPRGGHSAIWTGERMIVWDGGVDSLGGSYDPDGIDGDSDGFGCVLDCDDADPGVFAPADVVSGLGFAENGVTLFWDSVAPVSGSGTAYDIVRGNGTGFPVGSGTEICVAAAYPPAGGAAATIELNVSAEPDPGDMHWYIVRPTNQCGVGNYGATSDGVPRVSGTCG